MKRISILVLGVALCVSLAGTAHAKYRSEDYVGVDTFNEAQTHPLRIFAYLLHPVGYAVEQLVMRPIHYLVSRPYTADIFGYEPDEMAGY